jgi:transcriptional regulator with XRE-family HTH domain
MQRFGEKLRLLRTRQAMTVRDVATALGYVSSGRISEIENGKKTPSLAFVLRTATLFNVTPDQLLRDDIDLDAASDHPANIDDTP